MPRTKESDLIPLYTAEDVLRITSSFADKVFDPSDTGLTYRQIHLLDTREAAEGTWRRYCLSDLIGIEVVKRLKPLGVQGAAAQRVYGAFDPHQIRMEVGRDVLSQDAPWEYFSDVLSEILTGTQIIMVMDADGRPAFYTGWTFEEYTRKHDTFIYVDINAVVNAVYAEHGVELAPSYKSVLQIASDMLVNAPEKADLSPGERKLIDLVREGGYDAIRVKMQDGEIKLFYGETTRGTDSISPTELMQILREGDYQNVTMQMRGKKVVAITREEIMKPENA